MKRTKLLLSAFVGILLAFVMVFAVACGGGVEEGPKPNVRPAPQAPEKPAGDLGITDSSDEDLALMFIELVRSGKTNFKLGEEFTSDGLEVRAVYLNPDKEATIEDIEGNLDRVTLNAGDYVVDSSDYNPNRVGVYTIYVSYTFEGVTRTATYTVKVQAVDPAIGGIVAELADGKDNTFALTASAASVTVSKDILAVYTLEADASGKAVKSAEPIDADLYDAQLYLGSKLIEGNEAKENGTYSFVATLKADESKQDFIPVYIVNPVKSIELDQTAGSKFEQIKSLKDQISGTWQFTVTYESGVKKTVKAGDAGLTIEIDTNTVGEGTAIVTYVEGGVTVTCEVAYTIKAQQSGGGPAVTNNYSLNISELQAAIQERTGALTDKTQLDASDFTGSNSFLTFITEGAGTADQYRTSGNGLIEIKGDRLQVTFEGTGTITVSFASTGGSNESHFGLKDASGKYIEAASTTATLLTEGDDAGAYTVTGTGAVTVTFEITEAGTYTLCSPSGLTNRGCRISAITMIDTVGGGSVETNNYSLNISELVAAMEARLGAAPADKTQLDASDFTGSNSFLTFITEGVGTADQYRTSGNGLIEIKGDRLQVTFEGTGTITVSFASTGGSNESHFGLKDASGKYVEAASTTATLLTEGDDAGAYTVTGTGAVTVTFEITEAGTYTLCSPSGLTNRGCRISAITMMDTVGGSGSVVTDNYSLSISELQAAIQERTGALTDKTQLDASDFTGSNSFLTFITEGVGTADQYRTSGNGLIEIKGDRLQVTFEGTGTITVSFASTGGSNESHFGLKDASGKYIEAASTTATLLTEGDDAGAYTVTGTGAVTVTFEITEAGTYTLCSPSGLTNRGCRISAITMMDIH